VQEADPQQAIEDLAGERRVASPPAHINITQYELGTFIGLACAASCSNAAP
jgi:hypothetical protein